MRQCAIWRTRIIQSSGTPRLSSSMSVKAVNGAHGAIAGQQGRQRRLDFLVRRVGLGQARQCRCLSQGRPQRQVQLGDNLSQWRRDQFVFLQEGSPERIARCVVREFLAQTSRQRCRQYSVG